MCANLTGNRRAGFGIIFGVIVLFLIVMMTIGLAQLTFGSRVANDTQTTVVGGLATSIAQSAFEEAWHQIALAANTQGDPLYAQLRKEITDPAQAVFDFKVPTPETLAQVDATDGYSGFKLDGGIVKAEVLGAGTLAGLTYENMGTIKLTACVRHVPTKLARTLTMTRGFKVALLSTPRPFDQTTLFVMNPQHLLDPQGPVGANEKIREGMEVLRVLEQERRPDVRKKLLAACTAVNQRAAESDQVSQANPEEFTSILDAAVIPLVPTIKEDVAAERHFFPEAPGDYVIFILQKDVPDLSTLYLARNVQETQQDWETAMTRFNETQRKTLDLIYKIHNAAAKGEESYIQQQEQLKKELKDDLNLLKDAIDKLAALAMERLDIYQRFQKEFSERAGVGAKQLQQFASKFDVRGGQGGRAFYSFSGSGAPGALKALLDRYEKAGKPLNAIIQVEAGDQVLALENMRIHGKIVILATGRVALSNVKLEDPSLDLLTVHAGGRVTIDGQVQASVMAAGDVEISQGSVLQGNLILFKADSAQNWRGKLTRDDRYRSSRGGSPEEQLQGHFVVALSPRPASMIVDRQ